ncbi:MAG: hypothetical protein Q8N99_01025 [Nanoarchaeota archaeon]|nr:hypothetical protein [Nanoarchaeota archaeon]
MEEKRGIKKFLEDQGYENIKYRIAISLIILIIAIMIFLIFILAFYSKKCSDENCFFSSLNVCKRVNFIKEDSQSAWRYNIQGEAGNLCKVDIVLLKMKEGGYDTEKLQNEKMTCIIPKKLQGYPEEDLSKCSGKLKEDIQEIIIQKMHNYLLQNCGEIKKEFNMSIN